MASANSRTFNVQTLYIDAATVASVNDVTNPYPGQTGQFFSKNGCVYQLVQFYSGTTTIAAGTPVMWQDFDDFVVSAKVADSKRNFVAGLALGTVTAGSYGFIQVQGPYALAVQDGLTTASGDVLVMSASDGQLTKISAGTAPTYLPAGAATGSSTVVGSLASGTVAIQLSCPLNF